MAKQQKNEQPFVCAPHKAPGKPQSWQFPKTGHSAGYDGKYASKGQFEAETKRR